MRGGGERGEGHVRLFSEGQLSTFAAPKRSFRFRPLRTFTHPIVALQLAKAG